MLRIRITGLPDDMESFLSYVRGHFFISKESKAYKDSNSRYSRKYVEVKKKSHENEKQVEMLDELLGQAENDMEYIAVTGHACNVCGHDCKGSYIHCPHFE